MITGVGHPLEWQPVSCLTTDLRQGVEPPHRPRRRRAAQAPPPAVQADGSVRRTTPRDSRAAPMRLDYASWGGGGSKRSAASAAVGQSDRQRRPPQPIDGSSRVEPGGKRGAVSARLSTEGGPRPPQPLEASNRASLSGSAHKRGSIAASVPIGGRPKRGTRGVDYAAAMSGRKRGSEVTVAGRCDDGVARVDTIEMAEVSDGDIPRVRRMCVWRIGSRVVGRPLLLFSEPHGGSCLSLVGPGICRFIS